MSWWPRCLTIPRAPDFVIGPAERPYLLRWWIVPRNRLANLYLHRFCRSDDDRALHDHPWVNVSIILTGVYLEHLPDGAVKLRKAWRPWAPWRMTFRRAVAAHRIELIDGGRTVWTLFITGPKIRTWGFWCPQGWRRHDVFASLTASGSEITRGCE